MCDTVPGGAQGQILFVSRPIPLHGLCTIDLSRESPRHRGLSSGATREAVPFRNSLGRLTQYVGPCQRRARLTHLRRLCPQSHPYGQTAVYRRPVWRGSGGVGVCPRYHHDRSVFVSLSLGPVPPHQGRGQTPYLTRSSWQYPEFHPYQRWQDTRSQYPRSLGAGARGLLRHGSRLSRLCTVVPVPRRREFLCDPGKSNLQVQRRYSHPVDRATGVMCDQTVLLTGYYALKHFQAPLHRIRFKDPATNATVIFLSNNFALPALTITELYRCRWQVELFFKWIK